MNKKNLLLAAAMLLPGAAAHADEGMWMPTQLPDLAAQMKAAGFEGDPAGLADVTAPPLSSSAWAWVSPKSRY